MKKEKKLSRVKEIQIFSLVKGKLTGLTSNSAK